MESVTVNGRTYTDVGGNNNALEIRIPIDEAFGTGNVTVELESMTLRGNYGETVAYALNGTGVTACYIHKPLAVSGIRAVDANGNELHLVGSDETFYFVISCDNSEGYTIKSVTINDKIYTSFVSVTASEIKIASQSTWSFDGLALSKITYSSATMTQSTMKFDPAYTCEVRVMCVDQVVEIWTVADLLNIRNNTAYNQKYRLMADLDLSDTQVENFGTLQGWFDGNHHKISNLTLQGTYQNTDVYVGLFKDCPVDQIVTVTDLVIENVSVRVTLESYGENHIYYGGVIADAGWGNVMIVNVSHSGSVELDNRSADGHCYMGGMVGRSFETRPRFIGCTNNATMHSNVF